MAPPANDAPARRVHKEMGISHADFFRILPRVFEGQSYVVNDSTIVSENDGRRLRILLGEERERDLGGVVHIPVTFVELHFEGYTDAEQTAFVQHFDRAFFKGGG